MFNNELSLNVPETDHHHTEVIEDELVFQDTPASLQEDFNPQAFQEAEKNEIKNDVPEVVPIPNFENLPENTPTFEDFAEHAPTFADLPENAPNFENLPENTPTFGNLGEPALILSELEAQSESSDLLLSKQQENIFTTVPNMEEEPLDEEMSHISESNEMEEEKVEIEPEETPEDVEMQEPPHQSSPIPEEYEDPYAPKVVEDAFETCGVCLDPSAYEENQIIYCDGCDVAVHQHCYGVFKIPEGDWFCRACTSHIRHITPRNSEKLIHPKKDQYWGLTKECVLCESQPKQIKWALTEVAGRRQERRFCHVLCAQFISETWFEEKDTSTRVENVDNVQPVRHQGHCTFCGQSQGAKLLCSIKTCGEYFHAPCALAHGCTLEDVAPPTETYSNRVVYCIDHRPIIIEKGGNQLLKNLLKQTQNAKLDSNRNSLGWNWNQATHLLSQKRKRQQATKNQLKKRQQQIQQQKKIAKLKKMHASRKISAEVRDNKKKSKKWTMATHSDSETESEDSPVLPRPDQNITSRTVDNLKIRKHNSLSMKAARKFAPSSRTPSSGSDKKKKLKRKRESDSADSEHQKRKKINKKPVVTTIPKTRANHPPEARHSEPRRIDKSQTSKHGKARVYSELPRRRSFESRTKRRDEKEDYRKKDNWSRDHASDPRRRGDRYGSSEKYDREKGSSSSRFDRSPRYDKDNDVKRSVAPSSRSAAPDHAVANESPSPKKLPSVQHPVRRPPPPPPTYQAEVVVQGRPHSIYGGSMVQHPPTHAPPAPHKYPPRQKKVIWSGKMGKSTASDSFDLFFKWVAGHDVTQLPLPKEFSLPSKGRIRFENLTNFLPLMQKSSRKHLSLVEVHPQKGGSTPKYNDFCQYYREAERGAVVDLEKSYGITIYIMPVDDNWSRENLLKIKKCFGIPPPSGVMWAIIIQFPEIQKMLGERLGVPSQQRMQPNATEIKTIRIDPRQIHVDPRAAADPRMAGDPRMVADPRMSRKDTVSDLMNPDISDALKRLEQME